MSDLFKSDGTSTSRVHKWKSLFALNSTTPLRSCILNATSLKKNLAKEMSKLYGHLSTQLHFNINPLHGIELNTGSVTEFELNMLVCLCIHFQVKYTIVRAVGPKVQRAPWPQGQVGTSGRAPWSSPRSRGGYTKSLMRPTSTRPVGGSSFVPSAARSLPSVYVPSASPHGPSAVTRGLLGVDDAVLKAPE
jgi:hypothetical protein